MGDLDDAAPCSAENLRGLRCVETEEFQTAFAKSMPPNVTRRDLTRRTSDLQKEKLRGLMAGISGSDVTLMFGASAIHNRRFPNFGAPDQSGVASVKFARARSLDTPAAVCAISIVASELADAGAFVFALLSGNAPVFYLATGRKSDGDDKVPAVGAEESNAGGDDRRSDAGRVVAGAPHRDADVTAALAEEASQGIFGIRYAAHSLQLVLKHWGDAIAPYCLWRGSVSVAHSAEESVGMLAALYGGAPAKEERLRAL